MKFRTLLPFGLLCGCLFVLSACRDKQSLVDVLDRAELLMNESPDSAYTLLQTLPVAELHQDKNRARYALLYSQALDKNYIDETNDSLINIAVDYYRDTEDVRSKFLSFYYQGRVYTNAGESVKAMQAYTEAEQLADGVKDGYLLGLLYAELGKIYRLYYDYPKSLDAYQKSIEAYEQAGKFRHRNYMWLNQGRIYRNMGKNSDSERLLRMALAKGKEENDSVLIRLCLGDLVMQFVEMQDFVEARKLYNELQPMITPKWGTASFMGALSVLYASEGDFDLARKCIDKGWSRAVNRIDSVNLFLSSSEIEHEAGDEKKAYADLLEGAILQKSESHETLQQPIITVQRNFLAEKLEFQNYKFRMEKKLQIIAVSLASIVVLSFFYVFVKRLRRYYRKSLKEKLQKKESAYGKELERLKGVLVQKEQGIQKQMQSLDELMANNAFLCQRMDELKDEIKQNNDVLHLYMVESDKERQSLLDEKYRYAVLLEKLFKGKIKLLDSILYSLRSDSEDKNAVIQRATLLYTQIFKEYHQEEKAYLALEDMVNTCYDGIMVKLRSEIKLPNEDSYRQVCYHVAGFSVNVIALLMNETTNKLYKRRDRIRDRIVTMDTLNKELFVKLLLK